MRLERYLERNLDSPKRVEVAYIFGGDHLCHARAFVKHGLGVCIGARGGCDSSWTELEQELKKTGSRVILAKAPALNHSSTKARSGDQPLMEPLANEKTFSTLVRGPEIELRVRPHLEKSYNIPVSQNILRARSGTVNDTYFIGKDKALTIFKRRSPEQVAVIVNIANNDPSGLFPRPLRGPGGFVSMLAGRPGVLWARIKGVHYVEEDQSKLLPVPTGAHKYIASIFWKVNSYLAKWTNVSGPLGGFDYEEMRRQAKTDTKFRDLPEYLRRDHVLDYLNDASVVLKYPALVHTDMERQNLVHRKSGEVVGVLDLDSVMSGDLLFEFGHYLMNWAFSDPAYKPGNADLYLEAMARSGMINTDDARLLPMILRWFAAEDLLFYFRNDKTHKTDLARLSKTYDVALERADAYFLGFGDA
jgi:hypothetical protein